MPKGVITCRHRSKHSVGDVYFKGRYTIIRSVLRYLPDVIFAPGIADFLFPKAVPNEKKNIPTCVPQCYDVEKILIRFILDTNKYLLWQTVTTGTSHPPTQQAFSDRFWTILIHLYLNKWQCSFSVARERCDERRMVPWENWDWLYEDSKGADQPTHLYKLVCSYTVGIHENISNWIWKYTYARVFVLRIRVSCAFPTHCTCVDFKLRMKRESTYFETHEHSLAAL